MLQPVRYLYVYMLRCSDKTFYTGVTNNPEKRLLEHATEINNKCYTYKRRPLEMVYCEQFNNYELAITWEKRIKDWSRKKKEALINSDWEALKKFSECANNTNFKFTSRLRSK